MLTVTRRSGIAELTLDRPPVNAIDDAMIAAIHGALDQLADSSDFQVLHIRSAGKVFAAGADLSLIRTWKDAPSPGGALSAYIERLQGLYHRIESLSQVTLAEIAGAAMGGGYELALSCDLRIAAEEAKIGLPEVGLGLIPGAGGTQRLTRLCGRGVAARVILTAEPIDGKTAATLGMVEWAVPRAEIADRARAIADRLASMPAHAQKVAKQCIRGFGDTGVLGFQLERDLGGALLDSPRTQQLIHEFLARNSKQ
jgi:enoyl-CoA hydratase/carnithine racemase